MKETKGGGGVRGKGLVLIIRGWKHKRQNQGWEEGEKSNRLVNKADLWEKGEGKDKIILVISFLDEDHRVEWSGDALSIVSLYSDEQSLCGFLVPQCPVRSC